MITQRQRDILDFIDAYQHRHGGVSPTHREIAEHFGFSSFGTVYKHLSMLENHGWIRRIDNTTRGIVLTYRDRCPYCDRAFKEPA